MVKKLAKIEEEINNEVVDFHQHLNKILPESTLDFINHLQSKTKVYLFSGVIRNYFLKKSNELRDVDFIIKDDLDLETLFPNLFVKKNSFGGYKTEIESLTVDLWDIDKTWGLNQGQLSLSFSLLDRLPETTFFNFSSIIYSINDRKFIIGKPFLRFLRDKKMDIVLEENPYPALCIVNSFYYSEKYNLKFSEKLTKYLIENYNENINELEKIQIKHFKKIIYLRSEIREKINSLE